MKSHTHGLTLTSRPPLPIIFTVVEHSDKGAFTLNFAPSEKAQLPLLPGEYFAEVKIASAETAVDQAARSFTIGPTKDTTTWTSRRIS